MAGKESSMVERERESGREREGEEVNAGGGGCTGPTSLRASSSKTAISSLRSMSSPTSPKRRTIAARPPAQTGTGVCMRARLHVRVAHGQGRGAGSMPRGSRKSSHRESGRGTWRWSWRPRAPSLDMHARARTHTHAHAHDTRLATRDTRHATRHHVRRGIGASARPPRALRDGGGGRTDKGVGRYRAPLVARQLRARAAHARLLRGVLAGGHHHAEAFDSPRTLRGLRPTDSTNFEL